MLEFSNVTFSYGKRSVLKDFSLRLARGEIVAVMGPSGDGKTTLLRLAAGLEKPSGGSIVSSAQKISYVFQEPRLLPWLTVADNLRAVLETEADADARIAQMLDAVGLSDAKALYPDELSGGMKSRVALARALLYGGDLYLLDEPFAALDEGLRERLSVLLREHIKNSGACAILVTHQQSEAEAIADRIVTL